MTSETQQRAPAAEVRRLGRQLASRVAHDRKLGCTVRAADRDHVEALARRHGYELHTSPVEEPDRLWAEFWPLADGSQPA